jgi:hypothetical protein
MPFGSDYLDEKERVCAVCGASPAVKRCGACKAVNYCSAQCQREHWPNHKAFCGKKTEEDTVAREVALAEEKRRAGPERIAELNRIIEAERDRRSPADNAALDRRRILLNDERFIILRAPHVGGGGFTELHPQKGFIKWLVDTKNKGCLCEPGRLQTTGCATLCGRASRASWGSRPRRSRVSVCVCVR